MTNALEHQLDGAFRNAHALALAELGFGMPALLKMTASVGAVAAARQILAQPTAMFTKLFLKGRLDLSVEAIVLREQFQPLFEGDELRLAVERLRDSNFQIADDEDIRNQEAWGQVARRARSRWGEENPY